MSNEYDVYQRLLVRSDVWSRQNTSPDDRGKYGYNAQKYPLTRQIIDDSILSNHITIGAYTVKPIDNTVVNPTIDIDNHDGNTDVIQEVKIVYNSLIKAGMYPYIEASAGELKEGAHIGVICKPTLAKIAKHWMQKALDTTGLKHEVNPKQETVKDDGFGNLVKLPFQFNNRTKARSQIYNPETFEPFIRDDAIKYMLSLPDTVFKDIPESIKEAPKQESEPIKSNINLDVFFDTHTIKPCIVRAYKESWKLHGTGDEGHNFRIAIAGDMLYNGATREELHKYFSIQQDYKPRYTDDQIKSIEDYLASNKKPMGCKRIKEACSTLLKGMCTGCKNEPKEKKPREPKEHHIYNDVKDNLDEAFGVYRNNIELVEELQKITPIIYDESKNIWLWLNGKNYYERIDVTDVLSAIRKRTDAYVVNGETSSEIKRAIEITGRERYREIKPIQDTWINTASGIIDYKTGELIKANPEYFLKCPIPHKIGRNKDTPTIDKIFNDWIGDRKQTLYEILAYCLVDSYPIHRMFLLFGSGRNGKSQFLELLSRFIGVNNTTSTELEKLIDSRFECSKLYRKKAALIGETNFTAIKSSDRIKKITGHDMLTAEFKNKDPFDFTNTAKIIVATNSVPETLDKTEAFHSRCIIIEFKNRFNEGKPIIDTIPESEYENLLTKCLEILPKLLDSGHFTNEGTIEEKAEKYERLSNPFPTFKNKELIDEVGTDTPVWVIRNLYQAFCKKNGFRPVNETEFTLLLKKEGYECKRINKFGKKPNCVLDLTVKGGWEYSEDETTTRTTQDEVDEAKSYSTPIRDLSENTPSTSSNPVQVYKETTNPVTELTQMIINEARKTPVNSSNITEFSLKFCEVYKPQWQMNGESGYYTPSSIKGIASKLFKITPGVN